MHNYTLFESKKYNKHYMSSYYVTPEQMKIKLLEIADIISPKCKDFIIDLTHDSIINLYMKIRYALINNVIEMYSDTL
jgi:hypothetical protein